MDKDREGMAGDRDREKNGSKTEVGVGTAQGGDVPRNGYREGKGKEGTDQEGTGMGMGKEQGYSLGSEQGQR